MSNLHPDPSDEFCDKPGAEKLKAKIEAYWRERGHDVQVDVLKKGFTPAMRAARYDVRSELVNGLPKPKAIEQRDAA